MVEIVLGSSLFAKFMQEDVLFVDKSLLIKEVIKDKSDVILITRPRRWGKSLDLSMLQHFFASRVYGMATQGLFDKLAIASVDNGYYMQFQGQNPVIFITLKDIQAPKYENTIKKFMH